MTNRKDISDELREICPLLADLPPVMPYLVPEEYFNNLASALASQAMTGVVLPIAQPVYNIPEGYFDNLAESILQKIKSGEVSEVRIELETVAPFLNKISRVNVYEVPAGFFEGIDPIPARIPAKVVPMKRARRWIQYAAAAVVSGILVTGAFFFTDDSNDFRSPEKMDVSAELNKVSATELVKYLESPEHVQFTAGEATADVKNTISTASNEELNQYLTEHADDVVPAAMN